MRVISFFGKSQPSEAAPARKIAGPGALVPREITEGPFFLWSFSDPAIEKYFKLNAPTVVNEKPRALFESISQLKSSRDLAAERSLYKKKKKRKKDPNPRAMRVKTADESVRSMSHVAI